MEENDNCLSEGLGYQNKKSISPYSQRAHGRVEMNKVDGLSPKNQEKSIVIKEHAEGNQPARFAFTSSDGEILNILRKMASEIQEETGYAT